tara:strand:- start:1885 stop:2184 length:300 start_codon:yes stop_codon:yes gene_type:complete
LTWAWITATSVLLLLFCCSVYYNYKFATLILSLQDGIEESLDILDAKYASMSKVLEKPIFFDSVEVRQVISDIRDSRETVLYVANILGAIDQNAISEQS